MQPQKGAAITFLQIHLFLSFMPRYHENHQICQLCLITDVRGCLIPSLDITESPNPFRISGLLVKNHRPIFKTKYKDIPVSLSGS